MDLRWKINLIAIFILLGSTSCEWLRFKNTDEAEDDPVIATVGNQNLRKSDLIFTGSDALGRDDSINIASRFVQSWVKKQLLIKEASKKIAFDEAEINRKLLDYKYALMVYEFEKQYVEDNLNADFDESEIEKYYQANQENFNLKEIIVRVNFAKTEKDQAQNRQIEKGFRSNNVREWEEAKTLAGNFAVNYFLEDSTWIRFEEIITGTPIVSHPNKVELIRNNKLIVSEDERYKYFFRIIEYKLQDQVPPLEFVREEIIKILTNKRKIELVEQLQKEIYNRALDNNEFSIYQ